MRPAIGIGMAGYAFLGRAHSQAWCSADAFFDLPFRPSAVAAAGRSAAACAAWGSPPAPSPHRPSRTVQRVPAVVEQSAAEDSRFITVEGS
ncbi:hypothetical protein [Nonomuraea angiospora]|uniref:hypothetical protein n=1 Tax=Nonomuraea angiospora TaxID=46172 RepID=UPI0029B43AAC|nr:hypothetical protein [Nonomuraea angiospora]MDX3109267.1 hypothetical protein [Nonomuraea angiospora]